MAETLLDVQDLTVTFATDDGEVRAVDGLSYHLEQGEILGIVGESGSGKSVSSLALMGLVPCPPGKVSGKAIFEGRDLLSMPAREVRRLRGEKIAMIFQDPMTSLNPYLKVSTQLCEPMEVHRGTPRAEAMSKAIELLGLVGIPDPHERIGDYPHQFSGGQRQRIMIAMALMLDPDVLIADEPTTALDVTIQAQILDLLKTVREQKGTAIVLITHDLGVVAGTCDRVQVMYAGRLCETGQTADVFARPLHPYTQGLLASVPRLDHGRGERLSPITGNPPDLVRVPAGCAFHPRCPERVARCDQERPTLDERAPGHRGACWLHAEEGA